MAKLKPGVERRLPKPRKSAVPFANLGELLDRLGGIPPERVCGNPLPGSATPADYKQRNGKSDAGRAVELVDKTLVEKPMGASEPTLMQELAGHLWLYLQSNPVGFISGETYPL